MKCGLGDEWRKSAGQNIRQNEEILETIGAERSLMRTIKTKQKKWIGDAVRGESLIKKGNPRENARKKVKRKTKTNDAGLDDGRRI